MTGYASSNGPLIHFGLKNTDSVISLEVDWPDGFKHSFNDIKANNHYVISQSNSEGDRLSKILLQKNRNTIFNEVSEQVQPSIVKLFLMILNFSHYCPINFLITGRALRLEIRIGMESMNLS